MTWLPQLRKKHYSNEAIFPLVYTPLLLIAVLLNTTAEAPWFLWFFIYSVAAGAWNPVPPNNWILAVQWDFMIQQM